MNCCAECFSDRGLRSSIIPSLSTEVGQCSYCGSGHVQVVAPSQLSEYFELLVSAYRGDPQGKLLVEWFRVDWGLFRHPRMDYPRAKDLVAEILDDGEIVLKTFVPALDATFDRLVEWQTLREELMWRNRFFPKENIDLDRLGELLSHLMIDSSEVAHSWYRARIQTGEGPFGLAEMGAPPRKSAPFGRANPAGIPYLYIASTPMTAVSELRPHTGEIACVANFKMPSDLRLVDLRNPRQMVSPFLLVSAAEIGKMRGDLPFLERLGEELTRPVMPQAAAIDYTPSQYLCEFIKHCGYDGVVYRSSVSEGANLALFDPSIAVPISVSQYRVERVSIEIIASSTNLSS